MMELKSCYGELCERCVWKYNGGYSEWNGYGGMTNNAVN